MGDKRVRRVKRRNIEVSPQLWVGVCILCVLMALFVTLAVVTMNFIVELKADIVIVQTQQTAERNKAPPAQHHHPIPNHTHTVTPSEPFVFSVGSQIAHPLRPHLSTPTIVRFDEVFYNPHKVFRSNNRFFAPYKGVYSFAFSATSDHNKKVDLRLTRKKAQGNTTEVARALGKSTGVAAAASGNVILKLDVNEMVYLWMKFHNDTTNFLRNTSVPTTLFSGELIQRLD